MTKIPFPALCFALCFISPGVSHAQDNTPPTSEEPVSPDRPDFTEGPDTVEPGKLQLEGGYTYARQGGDKEQTFGEFLLRVPTGTRNELRFYLNSFQRDRGPSGKSSGYQDIAIGSKWKLQNGSETPLGRPSISVIALTTLPTGRHGIGENRWQPTVKLISEWTLTKTLGVAGNLNYSDASEGGRRFGQWAGSLSFGQALSPRWGSFLEYYGFFPGSRSGPNAHTLDTGVAYLINNDLQCDFRVGKGLNGISNDYFIGAGASTRW